MTDDNDTVRFSRRKLLGSVATVGAAGALGGAATNALLWDEEVFGSEGTPNVLQAGKIDLKVDYETQYYNGMAILPDGDNVPTTDGTEVDMPSDLDLAVRLSDIKPGDVFEQTIGLHLYGNPGFIASYAEIFTDDDNEINEPEDNADGSAGDELDGTSDGDLDDHLQTLIWLDGYDDGDTATQGAGNNFPNEILTADGVGTWDSNEDGDPDDREQFFRDIASSEDPLAMFDTEDPQFVYHGSFRDAVSGAGSSSSSVPVTLGDSVGIPAADYPGLEGAGLLLDATAYESAVASDFSSETNYCFEPDTVVYLGVLTWLPRDIPGVDDNIVQSDVVEYGFGFNAIQCRHNVGDDGRPVDRTLDDADAENNATGFGNTEA